MALNTDGPMPVNSKPIAKPIPGPSPTPSPGPSPTPSPTMPATKAHVSNQPYSGPTFQNPGANTHGTYYGGFHGLDGQQNRVQPGERSTYQVLQDRRGQIPNATRPVGSRTAPPTPIPNATRHAGPYVTPPASQLGAVNHPNDRTGTRAYAGLTGHAAPNALTDLHAAHATPPSLR